MATDLVALMDEFTALGPRHRRATMVLLDLYGQKHDAALWGDPYTSLWQPDSTLGVTTDLRVCV